MIDGCVTVGPNAVQGFKREGYGKWNVSLRDVWEMVCFPGFWKVSAKHFKTGMVEMKTHGGKRATYSWYVNTAQVSN